MDLLTGKAERRGGCRLPLQERLAGEQRRALGGSPVVQFAENGGGFVGKRGDFYTVSTGICVEGVCFGLLVEAIRYGRFGSFVYKVSGFGVGVA